MHHLARDVTHDDRDVTSAGGAVQPHMSTRSVLISLALAACGGGSAFPDGNLTDAPSHDSAGAGDAAGPARVSVRVRRVDGSGDDDAGAMVAFAGADGVITTTLTTDATGHASGTVAIGGSVTVAQADPDPTVRLITQTTIVGLQDGDAIEIGPEARDVGAMTITVPALAGATAYSASGPCLYADAPTPTLDVALSTGCASPRTIVVVADTPTGRQFLSQAGVTPVDGAALTMTGAWSPAASIAIAVTAPVAPAELRRDVLAAGGSAFGDPPTSVVGTTATFATPPGIGDAALLYANLGAHAIWQVAPLAATTFDAAPRLPGIAAVTPAADAITWTLDRPSTADAVVLDMEGGTEGHPIAWRAIVPGDATSFTLPSIAGLPGAPAPVTGLMLFDASTASWDQLRPTLAAALLRAAPIALTPGARVELSRR